MVEDVQSKHSVEPDPRPKGERTGVLGGHVPAKAPERFYVRIKAAISPRKDGKR